MEFCPHKVYTKKKGKPFVKKKESCVDRCRECEKICPKKAIFHHSSSLKKSNLVCSCGGDCE
ncbi:MAG: 4Fe-4S ferredoxin [Candidatus Micrarchaeia archaeon]